MILTFLTISLKLGRFNSSLNAGLKLSNCYGEDNIATYHALPGTEGDVELQWEAPNDYLGEIVFKYEIAVEYLHRFRV